MDPVYKGGPRLCAQITPSPNPTLETCYNEGDDEYGGAVGGEDWSFECLQTTHSEDISDHLSPLPWRETFNSSRTGICEDRPLSMTDFGDSLVEGDEAEEDFRTLFIELTETDISGKEIRSQQTISEEKPQSTSCWVPQMSKQASMRYVEEGSHQLYKVLYGQEAEALDSYSEGVSTLPVCSLSDDTNQVERDEVLETARLIKAEDVLSSVDDRDAHQTLGSSNLESLQDTNEASKYLADSFNVSCKFPGLMAQKENIIASDTFSTKLKASKHEPVSKIISDFEISSHERFALPECCPDSVILLTESRASSLESVSSVNELSSLAPDSPVTQFRPLSPLPPPVLPWESGNVGAANQMQHLPSSLEGTTCPFASEAEEKPLTPMVSNIKPFGRPVSPGSDYCDEGSISPWSLGFDIEDRASSPESGVLETVNSLLTPDQYVTPDFHEIRPSSSESTKSITSCCQLPPDSPVQDFNWFASKPYTCEYRSSSPESDSSHVEFEMGELIVFSENRPASPESAAYMDEYYAPSPNSPVLEFSPNRPDSPVLMTGEKFRPSEYSAEDYSSLTPSFNHDNRSFLPSSVKSRNESESFVSVVRYPAVSTESDGIAKVVFDSSDHKQQSLTFDKEDRSPTSVKFQTEKDDDWIIVSLPDVEKKKKSLDSRSIYRTSPQSALLDVRTPELETSNEHSVSTEVLSADVFKTELSHEFSNAGRSNEGMNVSEKSTCIKRKKSKKVKKHQKDVLSKTKEDTLVFGDKARCLMPSSPESEHEDLKLSLTLTTGVPEGQEESLAVKTLHHTPLPLIKHPQPIYNLVYDAEVWKFISPIRDPQYVGETFTSKVGKFLLSEKHSESCQVRSALQIEMCKRSLPFDSKAENRLMSPALLMPLDTATPQPSKSGSPANIQPDSPIPQSIPFFSGPSQHYVKPQSPELDFSDKELETDLNLSQLLDDRPSSPESVSSVNAYKALSINSPIPSFGMFSLNTFMGFRSVQSSSVESVFSDDEFGSLGSLFTELRPPSSDSVDENRVLSSDSPIPKFRQEMLDSSAQTTLEKPSSPVLFVSDIECRSVSTEFLFGESRPTSVDSVADDYPLLPESPVPEFGQFVRETNWTTLERSSSHISLASDTEPGSVSLELLICMSRPPSIDSADENHLLCSESPIPDFRKDLSDSHDLTSQTGVEKSLSPISFTSDIFVSDHRSFSMESLYGESRPLSVDSPDENGPLSPDSPIPDTRRGLLETRLYTLERSILDNGIMSQSVFCWRRTLSPESVLSGDDYQGDSPIPEFTAGFTKSVSVSAHRLSFSEGTQSTEIDVETTILNQRPASSKSPVFESTERLLSSNRQPEEAVSGTEYKFVYDPEFRKLISPILDPQYVGETFFSKTMGLEYVVTRTDNFSGMAEMKEPEDNVKLNSTEPEYKPLSPQEMTSINVQRSESPKLLKDLCLDSQVLQLSSDLANISQFLQYSPQSAVSEEESELFTFTRLSSPCSATSVNDMAALSPDSPIPDFKLAVSELNTASSGYKPSSPESVCSDIELGLSMPLVFIEQRPDSPKSLVSDLEHEHLVADPKRGTNQLICQLYDSHYVGDIFGNRAGLFENDKNRTEIVSLDSDAEETGRPKLPASGAEHEQNPEHSVDENRLFSPCSSIPQLSVSLFESPVRKNNSPTSSEHVLNVEPKTFDVPENHEYYNAVGVHWSSSTNSSSLDTKNVSGCTSTELCIQNRSDSPQSVSSETEMWSFLPESFMACKPMSPLSLIMTETRTSSPNSTTVINELCTLSPDSPLPPFIQNKELSVLASVSKSSSPTVEMSDTELETLDMPFTEVKQRSPTPDEYEFSILSPDSFESEDKHQDSPSTQFGTRSTERFPSFVGFNSASRASVPSNVYSLSRNLLCETQSKKNISESKPELENRHLSLDSDSEYRSSPVAMTLIFRSTYPDTQNEFRAFSPDSPIPEFQLVPQNSINSYMNYRGSSPESVSSDLEHETNYVVFCDDRSSSPDSLASASKYKKLSADSPVPDFRQALPNTYVDTSICRLSSPESIDSDMDFAPVNYPLAEDDERPKSPESICPFESTDSPIPQYTHYEPGTTTYRLASPESVYSDEGLETDVSITFLFEVRSTSPDSATSKDEYKPESPIPEYTLNKFTVCHTDLMPVSPESIFSEKDLETDLCMTWLFENRATSPSSTASNYEFKPLSPDSPIFEFTQTLQESSLSHFFSGSTSPESLLSNLETGLSFVVEDYPVSRESFTYLTEYTFISPDSPVPDFKQAFHSTYHELSGSRSSSPESEASEVEYALLSSQMYDYGDRAGSPISECSDSELKSLSPDSPVPQYYMPSPLISRAKYRSASPESLFSENDSETDLCMTLFFEDRGTSPGSAISKDEFGFLSPDSPIPAFTQTLQESHVSLLGSMTSSSNSLLSDLETEFSFAVVIEDYPIAPEYVSPTEHTFIPPDSPVPDFKLAFYGTYHEISHFQSSSLESEATKMECAPLVSQMCDYGDRAESPTLELSDSNLRCLSSDSLILQYPVVTLNILGTDYRSTSPESIFPEEGSDIDLGMPGIFKDRETPSDGATSLSPCQPDSPIPEFTQVLHESSISHFVSRSTSRESFLSDLEMQLSLSIEDYPISPEYFTSLTEYAFIPPDSPVPDFRQAFHSTYHELSGSRSSSPESEASEVEYAPLISQMYAYGDRAGSPISECSDPELKCLFPDSPVPQYYMPAPLILEAKYRSASPESLFSENDSETDLCMTLFFEDRGTSPGSTISKDELEFLSTDSPILAFTPALQESFVSHLGSRTSSPNSLLSDLEAEFFSAVIIEDYPISPENLTSPTEHTFIPPDSPVPDFRQAFYDSYHELSGSRSSSPESEVSEVKYAPLISKIYDYEDRTESPISECSDFELKCLSPDSPVPQYPMPAPTNLEIVKRYTSPESVLTDDLEMDLCMPWLFDGRAESPSSITSNGDLKFLLSDSPIPNFSFYKSTMPHMDLRSTSPVSWFSDLEMGLPIMTFTESRPSSPESIQSDKFSPDSPVPDFAPHVFELHETFFGQSSTSSNSICSETEYIVLSLGALSYDNRASSPGSGASGDENYALSPDSPIPDYAHKCVIINAAYRSSSPESIESDVEYALGELLISMGFGIDSRSDSNESLESTVEFLPEHQIMSLANIRSESPESTQSLDENKSLSPDSPLPWFTRNVFETVEKYNQGSSPASQMSDMENNLVYWASFDKEVSDRTMLSPQSEGSDNKCQHLNSESLVPDFRQTFVKAVTGTNISTEISDSDDLSEASIPFYVEERSDSPKSFNSHRDGLIASELPLLVNETTDSSVLTTSMEPFSSEEVVEYSLIHDTEMWKLTTQVQDPQFAEDAIDRKTGSAVLAHSELIDQFSSTEAAIPGISESCQLIPEHMSSTGAAPYREAKYTFEESSPDMQTWSDDLVSSFINYKDSDDQSNSVGLLSLTSLTMEEARAQSPESVQSLSVSQLLSIDSLIPEFRWELPECVQVFRSASSPPKTPVPGIDYMELFLVSNLVECRPFPESALSKNQNENERSLSPQSLPEYRPMSFESAMYAADRRASSPVSVPEFNNNRSLSPDSPIPQFTSAFEEYPTIHHSSSAESLDLDAEDEIIVVSSEALETSRPFSPESISSINEFSWLLPDSPVPEFMRILSSYFMDRTPFDKSSSPVSLSSESEFVALPIDCWIDDSPRPASPESVELEREFGYNVNEWLDSSSNFLQQDASLAQPNTKLMTMSPSMTQSMKNMFECEHFSPNCGQMKESQSDIWTYEGHTVYGVESESSSRVPVVIDEEEFKTDLPQKPSPVKDVKRKVQPMAAVDLKSKIASYRVLGDIKIKQLSATPPTQGGLFIDDQQVTSLPIQLPAQSSHRKYLTVTPVLPTFEKSSYTESDAPHGYSEWESFPKGAQSSELFSPMPDQILVPPDYEAVFSGDQTLTVSQYSRASSDDLSPLSPVFSDFSSAQPAAQDNIGGVSKIVENFQFSPDFKRVLSDFERTALEFELQDPNIKPMESIKVSKSPEHSDSDQEFFDCRQDFSESDDVEEPEHEAAYHISEPPFPKPIISDMSTLKVSREFSMQPFLQVGDPRRFSFGSESLGDFDYDSEASQECATKGDVHTCEELPSRDQAGYYDDDDSLGREIAEELGTLSSDSSEEEVLTTRVVRRRIIIQADNLPDIPPQTVTEETYTDEHGNMVVKKITRKVIRKYVSPDGSEIQDVSIEGSHQEKVQIEEGDAVSTVVKRTVLHTEGDQKELTFSEPRALGPATASEFEAEPVQGRRVSKVVKTTVVRGERTEKQRGDPSLAADLPSAQYDFQKALSYAGGFGNVLLPQVVEREVEQDDGSVVKRSQMRKCRTQKRTVVRDAQGKHVHLERLDDTPDTLQPDALQHHMHRLLQRYCEEEED